MSASVSTLSFVAVPATQVAQPTPLVAVPAVSSLDAREFKTSSSGSQALVAAAVGVAALAGRGLHSRTAKRAKRTARASGAQKAVPFLPAPQYWEWAQGVPGDSGFDPLNFWKGNDLGSFANQDLDMRDAEIKHCRLAMLAAVHWPLAEMYHSEIAAALGMPSKLTASGLNPSLLNGRLDDPALAPFLGVAVLAAALTDLSKKKGTEPGDFGFDPLNLRNAEPPVLPGIFKLGAGRPWMAEAEIKHGRLAMVAISAFAAQEKLSHLPLAQETPGLFGA